MSPSLKFLNLFLLLAFTLLATPVFSQSGQPPQLPSIPQTVFSIADFGAVSDDKTDNAPAVQAAINAARSAGGGTVLVPPGTFLCGPLQLASQINLQLSSGATLRLLPMARYPGRGGETANFLEGKNLHDVAVSGEGTIDGQGAPWWPHYKEPDFKRPVLVHLAACQRVLIENVTLKNSPSFHLAIGAQHLTVRGVTIQAPPSDDPVTPGHNTDACDVSGQHILIDHCSVSVGDDDFTCGGNTSDVVISHCTYGYGHGVSIGSYTKGGVSNITVTDCTFTNTEAGVRIKSDRGRGGLVENITYRNLTMTNVGIPIVIYGAYLAKEPKYRDLNRLKADTALGYPSLPLTDTTPVFSHIRFININAVAARGHRAGLIWGLPEAFAANLLFQKVTISADLPFGLFNTRDVEFDQVKITTPEGVNKIDQGNATVP